MSRTPELYRLDDKSYTINRFSDTYYDIILSLKHRDDYPSLWGEVHDLKRNWYELLDMVGVDIRFTNRHGTCTPYSIRNFYKVDSYENSKKAASDLEAIRKEANKLESKLRNAHYVNLENEFLGDLIIGEMEEFVKERVIESQKPVFKIVNSTYDSEQHVEFITIQIKDYNFEVEYHFKSADCDLRGCYKGNKVAFIHYSCWKGSVLHDGDESDLVKLYTPNNVNYGESADELVDYIIKLTGLDKGTVSYKILAALNERTDHDTNDYLDNHSHYTRYVYKDKGGHIKGDWKYEIIANWSRETLNRLIDQYKSDCSPSVIGAYLINNGLVNELSVKVTCDLETIADLTLKSENDPDVIKVLSFMTPTKEHYMPFRKELELYLTRTFSDEVIRLPENTDKILNELGATLTQRKLVAEDFKKIS